MSAKKTSQEKAEVQFVIDSSPGRDCTLVAMAAHVLDFVVVPYLLQALLFLCCLLLVCVTMAPPPEKKKRVVLTLEKKMEVLDKVDAGWPTSRILREFNLARSTFFDIKKSRDKLTQYTADFASKTKRNVQRKIMYPPRFAEVDRSTLIWYRQQRAAGVLVRGTELKAAAEKFARLHDTPDFKASEGWLFAFKLRHGFTNRKAHGEAVNVNEEGVEEFRQKVKGLIDRGGLTLGQVYNLLEDSDEDSDDDADSSLCATTPAIPKLSALREHVEFILDYLEHPDCDREVGPLGLVEEVRAFRQRIISRQNRRTFHQSTTDNFFRPVTRALPSPGSTPLPHQEPPPTSKPQPSTSAMLESPLDVSLRLSSESSAVGSPSPHPSDAPLGHLPH